MLKLLGVVALLYVPRGASVEENFNTPEFYGWVAQAHHLTVLRPFPGEAVGRTFRLAWCTASTGARRLDLHEAITLQVDATACGSVVASSTDACFDGEATLDASCVATDVAQHGLSLQARSGRRPSFHLMQPSRSPSVFRILQVTATDEAGRIHDSRAISIRVVLDYADEIAATDAADCAAILEMLRATAVPPHSADSPTLSDMTTTLRSEGAVCAGRPVAEIVDVETADDCAAHCSAADGRRLRCAFVSHWQYVRPGLCQLFSACPRFEVHPCHVRTGTGPIRCSICTGVGPIRCHIRGLGLVSPSSDGVCARAHTLFGGRGRQWAGASALGARAT